MTMKGAQLHIVTPLHERGSLARRVAERGAGLEPAEVAEVAVQVLEGLQELHERGIVHGGVTPTNVLVEEGGGVVLADCGLATVAERMGVPVSGRGGGGVAAGRCGCGAAGMFASVLMI